MLPWIFQSVKAESGLSGYPVYAGAGRGAGLGLGLKNGETMPANGEPAAGIFQIAAVCLEPEGTIITAKYIDAAVAIGRFD